MTDRATGSDVTPNGVPLRVRMRNRKLRNIRPSGAFDQNWRYKTSPVVTEGAPLVFRMRNRKLRNIHPSVAFWPEVTSSPIGLPLEAGGVL
jgi:hypothetical protein